MNNILGLYNTGVEIENTLGFFKVWPYHGFNNSLTIPNNGNLNS